MDKLIGNRINQAQNLRNLTQENLSELTELSVSVISRLETGHNSTSLKTLSKICKVLDISLDYILYDILSGETKTTDPTTSDIILLPDSLTEEQKFLFAMFLIYIFQNLNSLYYTFLLQTILSFI